MRLTGIMHCTVKKYGIYISCNVQAAQSITDGLLCSKNVEQIICLYNVVSLLRISAEYIYRTA